MGYQFLSNFKYNYNAFSLEFDEGVTFKNGNASGLFSYCYGFEPNQPVVIPADTTNCAEMFRSCFNLNQPVTIPEGVNNISGMFYGCRSLDQDMYVPYYVNGNALFESCNSFNSDVEFDDFIDTLSFTFQYCDNLNRDLTLPSGLVNMISTFSRCNNFNVALSLPYGLDKMVNTFYYCNSFNTNIQIPNTVTDMTYTFADCHNFDQDLALPNSLQRLYGTFRYCSSLTQNIQIPDSVTDTGVAFQSCTLYNHAPMLPSGLISATGMFSYCPNFDQSITLPEGIQSVGGMFQYCTNFNQYISIPNSVIGAASMFRGCTNFNQVVNVNTPNMLSAGYIFENCQNLYISSVSFGSNCNNLNNACAHTKIRNVTLHANYYRFDDLVGLFNTIDKDYHLDFSSIRPSYYDLNTEEWVIGDALYHLTMPKNAMIYNYIYRQNYSAQTIGSRGWIEPIFGVVYYSLNGRMDQPQSYEGYNGSSYYKDRYRASIFNTLPYNADTGNAVAMYCDWQNSVFNVEMNQYVPPRYACVITLV